MNDANNPPASVGGVCHKLVLTLGNGSFRSMYACKGLDVTYRLNMWTEAKIGGLLAFDTEEHAMEYAEKHGGTLALMVCTGDWPIGLPTHKADISVFGNAEEIDNIWSCDYKPDGRGIKGWPDGTMAFRRIMPLSCRPVQIFT